MPKLSCRGEKPGRPCCLEAAVISPSSDRGLHKKRAPDLSKGQVGSCQVAEVCRRQALSYRAPTETQSSWACPVWNNWSRTWPWLRKGPWSQPSWKPLTKPGTLLPTSVPTTSAKMHLTWGGAAYCLLCLCWVSSDWVVLSLFIQVSLFFSPADFLYSQLPFM